MEVSVKELKEEANQPTGQGDNAPIAEAAEFSAEDKALLKAITKDNIPDDAERIKKRKAQLAKNSVEPVDFAYERAIGRNDSLYSNFAELIALTKRKVCLLVTREAGSQSFGTGFMVSRRLLLTNWHVFKNKQMANEGEAHFFYEYDAQGHRLSPVVFRFDTTTGFFNDRLLDYCFVAVQPMDVTGKVSLESIGYLYLDLATGKVGAKGVEKLNIIHHPRGDYKQLSIRENTFLDVSKTKIFYETDTAPGSSGSPVLNDQWQVVGLHHKSVPSMSADGKEYLDKAGDIIPIQNGKIDATRIHWIKNEGIRISVILKHVAGKNPNNELIAGLAAPPPSEDLAFTTKAGSASLEVQQGTVADDSRENQGGVAGAASQHININVPVSALRYDQSIEISLSSKIIAAGKVIDTSKTQITSSATETSDEFLLESARLTKEQKVDFSLCQGYDPNFLGVKIRLPRPKKSVKNQIARLIGNEQEIELKYFKYSVIFNTTTRMPLLSAVNVEGDATQRLDASKRKDDWLRDKRIPFEHQLTDEYYLKSNFARGHMSRFEDANWDGTENKELDEMAIKELREKAALRNGTYTCFYTNACPQVATLNGPGGLWGKLEKAVLEQGIKKETDQREARMTVFNGPIFNEQKDRIYKGVRIPTEFYKIIMWLNDENQLKATAFKLSQETLLGVVDFTAKADEALDIDQDVKFKNFQCSIKSLGNLTDIDFKHLEKFDTFVTNDGGEENFIEDTTAIVL